MPTTYTLVPVPRWYFADNFGLPLGQGSMKTWRALAPFVDEKPIFTDSSGNYPWPNPVNFDANGMAPGMFFWADDEPYFVQIFDNVNGTGNVVFTFNNYGPGISGGGGGGGTTTIGTLKNYVVNNVFWRNNGPFQSPPTLNYTTLTNGTIICAGNHEGFRVPDVTYYRSSGDTSSEIVTLIPFGNGVNPLTPDVTPEYYLDWNCTAATAGTYKAFQWPIDLHVKNLETQTMTAIIWAKGVTGNVNLTMNFLQDFGTDTNPPTLGVSAFVLTTIPIAASPLGGSWSAYAAQFTIPSTGGKTLSPGGDDASYLWVNMPVGAVGHIQFTKPKLYLGQTGAVVAELQTYDEIDSVISSPRTGDIRMSINSFSPYGWVAMNDTTIGNTGSGANGRANQDTWQLYNLLWTNVSQANAPVSSGMRGTSAIADFNAGFTIALTKTLGRALASVGQANGTGTTWALCQAGGSETHVLTSAELPNPLTGGAAVFLASGTTTDQGVIASSFTAGSGTIANGGGGNAHSIVQATTFLNVFIKL